MAIQTTYTQAHASLAKLLEEVTHNRHVVIIRRRGEEDVALVSADEPGSPLETANLLRILCLATTSLTHLISSRTPN